MLNKKHIICAITLTLSSLLLHRFRPPPSIHSFIVLENVKRQTNGAKERRRKKAPKKSPTSPTGNDAGQPRTALWEPSRLGRIASSPRNEAIFASWLTFKGHLGKSLKKRGLHPNCLVFSLLQAEEEKRAFLLPSLSSPLWHSPPTYLPLAFHPTRLSGQRGKADPVRSRREQEAPRLNKEETPRE